MTQRRSETYCCSSLRSYMVTSNGQRANLHSVPSSRVSPSAGKSTLLKLMVGENRACEGSVSSRPGLVIGRYHQHSAEVLDPELTPVEYIEKKFKEKLGDKGLQVRIACLTEGWDMARAKNDLVLFIPIGLQCDQTICTPFP